MGKARLAGSLGRDREHDNERRQADLPERDTAATPSSPRECGLGVRHLGRLPGGHLPAVGDLRIHRKVADREVLLLAGGLHVHLGHAVDDADIAAHPHLAVARRSPAIVRLPACRLDTCSFLDSTRALECTYTRSSARAELSAAQSCFTIAWNRRSSAAMISCSLMARVLRRYSADRVPVAVGRSCQSVVGVVKR